jgi:hypothetical protein
MNDVNQLSFELASAAVLLADIVTDAELSSAVIGLVTRIVQCEVKNRALQVVDAQEVTWLILAADRFADIVIEERLNGLSNEVILAARLFVRKGYSAFGV